MIKVPWQCFAFSCYMLHKSWLKWGKGWEHESMVETLAPLCLVHCKPHCCLPHCLPVCAGLCWQQWALDWEMTASRIAWCTLAWRARWPEGWNLLLCSYMLLSGTILTLVTTCNVWKGVLSQTKEAQSSHCHSWRESESCMNIFFITYEIHSARKNMRQLDSMGKQKNHPNSWSC